MLQDLKKVGKELEKIFGKAATDKVWSHLSSLNERIEELIKSRDNWKRKYLRIKKQK